MLLWTRRLQLGQSGRKEVSRRPPTFPSLSKINIKVTILSEKFFSAKFFAGNLASNVVKPDENFSPKLNKNFARIPKKLEKMFFSIEFFFLNVLLWTHWTLLWQSRRKNFSNKWEAFAQKTNCRNCYKFSINHVVSKCLSGQMECISDKLAGNISLKGRIVSLNVQNESNFWLCQKNHSSSRWSHGHVEYKVVNPGNYFLPTSKETAHKSKKLPENFLTVLVWKF